MRSGPMAGASLRGAASHVLNVAIDDVGGNRRAYGGDHVGRQKFVIPPPNQAVLGRAEWLLRAARCLFSATELLDG